MQEYSRGLEELTGLKKTSGSQALEIQRLQQELDTYKNVNTELAKHNKTLQQKMSETNQKYLQIQQQQLQMTQLYDAQIVELKSLVDRKSVELERISMNILPKFDQDMIRIKLLNELELPHRQQIESRDDHIKKLEKMILELEKKVELQTSKFQGLQEQHKKQLQHLKAFHTSEVSKLTRELQDAVDKHNSSKDVVRKAKRQTQETRQRLSSFKKTYQERIDELENQRHENSSVYKHEMEVNNLKKDIQHLKAQLKESKEENNRSFRELQKSRDDYSKLALKWQQQESIITDLRLRERQYIKQEENASKQSTELENLQSAIKAKTKELENAKSQNINDSNKIRSLQKDLSQAREDIKNHKAQPTVIDQPVFPRNPAKSTDDASMLNQISKLKIENLSLIEKLTAKQRELQSAISQMEKNRKRHITPDKDKNLPQQAKVSALRQKLRVANEKIVTLLKDKIQMGRRLSPSPR